LAQGGSKKVPPLGVDMLHLRLSTSRDSWSSAPSWDVLGPPISGAPTNPDPNPNVRHARLVLGLAQAGSVGGALRTGPRRGEACGENGSCGCESAKGGRSHPAWRDLRILARSHTQAAAARAATACPTLRSSWQPSSGSPTLGSFDPGNPSPSPDPNPNPEP
jgi:hypothetical protein